MKKKKKNWIVRMRCEVTKDVFVDDCTEEQARCNPWGHSSNEVEIDQHNWEVKSVKPNE